MNKEIERIEEDEYIIDGGMKITDVNELFGTKLESDDFNLVGGYVMGVIGHIPVRGDAVNFNKIISVISFIYFHAYVPDICGRGSMILSKIRCPKCKGYYDNYGMLTIACPSCIEKLDEQYMSVRTYVKEHNGATVTEVSNQTGVPYNKIIDYIKMEILEIRGDSNTFLSCGSCGVKIYTGVLCDDCKRRTGSQQQVIMGQAREIESKMHIVPGTGEESLLGIKKPKKL